MSSVRELCKFFGRPSAVRPSSTPRSYSYLSALKPRDCSRLSSSIVGSAAMKRSNILGIPLRL